MKPTIDLQSLVDSHEQPFIIIDRDFKVVALNRSHQQSYHIPPDRAVGRHCYEVSHGLSRPCFENGEECPHQQVFEDTNARSCLHTHRDEQGRSHWVRVTAHPLPGTDGTLYLGESIKEISVQEEAAEAAAGPRMVGASPAFLAMVEQLQIAAQAEVPVLLLGETGTGKELAAQFLHRESRRRGNPFQTIDCTVLNETLVESELFGHERGAFTGSTGTKKGLFEAADGGTLFLDEIGDLPASMQAKLLRVLECGEFRRVGGHQQRRVDVRVVCATNRHLWEAVKSGHFREDLYYRIACMSVHLPSLRERLQDLPVLVECLLEAHYRATGRHCRISKEALALLARQRFPGNIRELRNMLCAAAAHSREGLVGSGDIEQALRFQTQGEIPRAPAAVEPELENQPVVKPPCAGIGELEARHIASVLEQMGGHKGRTAEALGISTRTLYRKIKQYGLS